MRESFTKGQVRLAESIEHPLLMLEVRGSNPALSEDTTILPPKPSGSLTLSMRSATDLNWGRCRITYSKNSFTKLLVY